MTHAVGTVLAFMVFAGLWLLSQDWIDALPKRLARGIGSFVAVTLLGTLYLTPGAYEAGTTRFANYVVDKIRNQLDNVPRDVRR